MRLCFLLARGSKVVLIFSIPMSGSCGRLCLHDLRRIWTVLRSRSVVRVKGPDVEKFFQNLVTQDVRDIGILTEGRHAGFLSSRGRLLHDTILSRPSEEEFLVDVDRANAARLTRQLNIYKLRANVKISDASDELSVWSFAGVPSAEALNVNPVTAFSDPRSKALGLRMILEKTSRPLLPENVTGVTEKVYQVIRTLNGICEGSVESQGDFTEEELPLECNLDVTGGVSFEKGCYIGQELTARTHHTGVVRKRFFPMAIDKSPDRALRAAQVAQEYIHSDQTTLIPQNLVDYDANYKLSGSSIEREGANRPTGELRSSVYNLSMSHIRFEQAFDDDGKSTVFNVGEQFAVAWKPDWFQQLKRMR
ncbi:hypothetical protein NDN08_000032 [Rhodosorus marinus]|uniref:GCVT N-terminal domain-containing protein n=1 Tax=Rhodosorus marinus TaxID=101924 RepID=A0AAV8UJ90_9RHOD|nr:hypothetical protein NDN08_000032 [Rhodosorus marinus]